MSFLKSAINQVGRDMGRVVSNQVFKDSHSTPYRRTGNKTSQRSTNTKSEFDKAIEFQTGHRPSTLINKILGVYTVIKNEANHYISDGYLDTNEANNLFLMMNKFNSKIEDICDVLEIDEIANQKEISQLTKIVEKNNILFKNVLKISADGCEKRKLELIEKSKNIENLSFIKFIGLNTIWMGRYAKTGKKNLVATIFANMFSFGCFGFPYIFSTLNGLLTFSGVNKKRKELKKTYEELAELESKRGKSYLEIGI